MSLADILADAGLDVEEAESGDAALSLFGKPEAFDILVTDIQMPGEVDGLGLGRRARLWVPDIGIIYVTGRPDHVRRQLSQLGAQEAFVPKPYRGDQILGTISGLLSARPGYSAANA
jgi:CheY-like chemotaxis protein